MNCYTMNTLKTALYLSVRGYRRNQQARHRGPRQSVSKLDEPTKLCTEEQLYKDIGDSEFEGDIDCDDPDRFESDFTSAHQSYKDHQREMFAEQEKLKMRIVRRKYFKSDDPNFVTWSEKEQIRSLHEQDSTEWTPERLSECFPALPETVQRILKAKWMPKNIDTVVKYDEKVIDNWERFKAGKIGISPQLEEHLKKFKGRKIEIGDLKMTADKFVEKPLIFPKPKTQIFSSIVQSVIDSDKSPEPIQKITDGKSFESHSSKRQTIQERKDGKKPLTFDSFLEKSVEGINKKGDLSLENELLIEEYKERKNIQALDKINANNSTHELINATSLDNFEDLSNELMNTSPSNAALSQHFDTNLTEIKVPNLKIERGSMTTGIIEWKKKATCGEEDYPNFIKIPRAKAKDGVTFRVQDRYYDTDGEFLYRVPGLKS